MDQNNKGFLDYLRSMVASNPDVQKQMELEAKKRALEQMQNNLSLDQDKAKAFVQGFKGVK